MDHGIESRREREQRGKPSHGTVEVSFAAGTDQLEIQYADDGRGLDLAKVRRVAIAKGLIDEHIPATAAATADLIFASGLTTASQVTDISGRGVGMDAVKTYLTEQGGSIQITLAENGRLDATPFVFLIRIPLGLYVHRTGT